MWQQQKAVIRGQGYNLIDILSLARTRDASPFELIQRPLVLIHEDPSDPDEELISEQFGVENESLETAPRFLLLQQINFRRVTQRLETKIRRAFFRDC